MAYQGTSSAQDFKNLQADLRAKARAGSFAYLQNGVLQVDWPYRSGGWSNSAPKTHADWLTLLGIPASAPFYPSLYKALNVRPGTPMPTHGWNVTTTHESGPSFSTFVSTAANAVTSVYNAIPKPVTALLAPQALITDMAIQHPEMIPLFGKQAAQAKALFEGVKAGNVSLSDAANIAAQAIGPNLHLPPDVANAVTAAAHMAAAASPLASQALQIAQASGQAHAAAAVPHPLALTLSPPKPAPPAVHAELAAQAEAGLPPPTVHVALPALPAPKAGTPMAPPASALHVSQAPGSPGAPKGATFWHCEPLPGGHWQCQWK
jgi:hypothetical protein